MHGNTAIEVVRCIRDALICAAYTTAAIHPHKGHSWQSPLLTSNGSSACSQQRAAGKYIALHMSKQARTTK